MFTHGELIQIASKWLQQKCSIIITELVTYAGEIPDVIGFNHYQSILIECKTTRKDFFADQKKGIRKNNIGMGNYKYYLCPKGLIQQNEIHNDYWGLLEVSPNKKVTITMVPYICSDDIKNLKMERSLLVSAIRRIGQHSPKGIGIKCYQHDNKRKAGIMIERIS